LLDKMNLYFTATGPERVELIAYAVLLSSDPMVLTTRFRPAAVALEHFI
jgi:hypothetical protein